MKHQYESELIKEIVETGGHEKSSLHYESECVETWIKEAKGAYPKLCDYESEWLNYISILDDTGGSEDPEPPIGEFPYVVLSDVAEATVDNVVPLAYKSAVLKGQTLVNIINSNNPKHNFIDYNLLMVDNTKTYYVKFEASVPVSVIGLIVDDSKWNVNKSHVDSTNGYVILTPDKNQPISALRLRFDDNKDTANIPSVNLVCIVYQEGMENWDIPFFEGMTSVRMPVLTSTNEDGTKSNILTVNEDVELQGIGDSSKRVEDELDCLTGELTQRVGEIVLDGSSDEECVQSGLRLNNTVAFGIMIYDSKTEGASINNKFITSAVDDNRDYEHSYSSKNDKGNLVWFFINKGKLSSVNVSGFRQWLSQNPLTLQYELATESVKTVDLLVQNQDGKTLSVIKPIEGTMHLSTSSDTINPLFSGEIPVEATTQNLASFIDLEMEE